MLATATVSFGGVQSVELDFSTDDQSMWGPGPGTNLDRTWDDFLFRFADHGTVGGTVLGSGVTLPYSYSGTVGLEPRLRISTGTVDVAYPIQVNASLPDVVVRNDSFTIDTVDWLHRTSEISATGPGARFTLDAVLKFDASIGAGTISGAGFPLVDIPKVDLGVDFRKTIIDVGSGGSGISFPAGPYGTVSLSVPDILELSSQTLLPPELARLRAEGQGDDRFLNLGVDLDALAVSLFGLPPNLLGDEYVIVPDGGGDPRPDLSIAYDLLDVQANLGLKFAQAMTFQPTSIGVTMISDSGEVRSGVLGDTFSFTAPDVAGPFGIDAEYTLNGQLRSQTGFVVNGSLEVQAGKFVLHNEFGPDFDVNLASLLGLDGEYLFAEELPDGGLNLGPPIYVFDRTFGLGGFESQGASYSIMVMAVPDGSGSWLMSLVAVLGVGLLRPRGGGRG